MAIFRPKIESGNKFYGICKIGIIEFEDKTDQYEWADLYLNVIVKQEGSEYTRNLKIAGSFEKDADGLITGGTVLRRMYSFFDSIGCKVGINVHGKFEDADGNEIDSLEDHLNKEWVNPLHTEQQPSLDYLAYIYKEKPKKAGDKAWTRVWHKLYRNEEANVSKLQDDVNWLKSKGVIKEFDGTEPTSTPNNNFNNSGLTNL